MTLSLTINETLKWLSSLPIISHLASVDVKQNVLLPIFCRGHSGGDSVALGLIIISLFPHLRPSLRSLMVSVDVKHHKTSGGGGGVSNFVSAESHCFHNQADPPDRESCAGFSFYAARLARADKSRLV